METSDYVGHSTFRAYRQFDRYTCGAHSVRGVLRAFGRTTDWRGLKEDLRTTPERGTGPGAMLRVLRDKGLRAWSRNGLSVVDLRGFLVRGALCIGTVHHLRHWVVFHGMSRAYVSVADSSGFLSTRRELTYREFGDWWDHN